MTTLPAHNAAYTDLVNDRKKASNGEYLGTIGGVRVRFVNVPCKNPGSIRTFAPVYPNWNVYREDNGKCIAEGWASRLGAAHSVARMIARGFIA